MSTKMLITLVVIVFFAYFIAKRNQCQRLNQGYINYKPFLKIMKHCTYIHISKLKKKIEHSVRVIINYRAY